MRRLTCVIILAAFVFSSGGNWAVLQGLAWANMIREYAQMVPLKEAVRMTLSGEYPCAICKAIAEKKNSEQQKVVTLQKYEKLFPLPVAGLALALKISPLEYPAFAADAVSRPETPPTPPPRFALS